MGTYFENIFSPYLSGFGKRYSCQHVLMRMTEKWRTTLDNRELAILGRERRRRLHKTKTAITDIKAVQLCRKHNLKDLFSE